LTYAPIPFKNVKSKGAAPFMVIPVLPFAKDLNELKTAERD
jgi:hypothetical protein